MTITYSVARGGDPDAAVEHVCSTKELAVAGRGHASTESRGAPPHPRLRSSMAREPVAHLEDDAGGAAAARSRPAKRIEAESEIYAGPIYTYGLAI